MESHLLDGLLGRSATFFGLLFLFYPVIENKFHLEAPVLQQNSKMRLGSASLVILGSLISLAAVVLSASEVNAENASLFRFDFEVLSQWAWPVISQTQFGWTWLLFLGLFITAWWGRFFERKYRAFFGVALIALFSRLGHGGAFDVTSFWYAVHVIHLGAVISWIMALGAFAVFLFSKGKFPAAFNLLKFGKFMDYVMPVLLISGTTRSLLLWPSRQMFFIEPYLWMLAFKIFLVSFVLLVAFKMRQHLKSYNQDTAIRIFSIEITLAGFTVFISILLSQLAPP